SLDLDDDELIRKASQAKNGEKFAALWKGDTSGYPSPSEADLALCGMLAFWTQGDTARIDALFRKSGLYREKWDRVGPGTIAKALQGKTEFYTPRHDTKAAGGKTKAKKNQASTLVELALRAGVELFHTPGGYDSEGYASLEINGHSE